MSQLDSVLKRAVHRFRQGHPYAPAQTFVFGFVTPEFESCSISLNREHAAVISGVRDADYLIFAAREAIEALLDPDADDRAAIVSAIRFRPDYPFRNYLISILLNSLDLGIADLDYAAKRFDGPFPFPPRYPAHENPFRQRTYEPENLPVYDPLRLPQIIADEHPSWVGLYNKAWQLAFRNLRQPEPASGFTANFIDPAFNANIYLWDSCFMTMFGRYARSTFRFMGTLDNFYAKQHDDGFICREINSFSGSDLFQSLDPRSTGPNILAWTEWLDYQFSGDRQRLSEVFAALVAYHRWWKDWRTHPDGGYWTSGWGSGMDNQTRVPGSEYHHRRWSWVDANMQQALSCTSLLSISSAIGRSEFDEDLHAELEFLRRYINERLWDEASGFYVDRSPTGELSRTKSVAAFWGLLSDVVPPDRAKRLIAHLTDERSFNRPHRVPTQSADSDVYNPHGGYWLGGVWSPTNYMVLSGLARQQAFDLAHEIACNHLDNIAAVFEETGTLFENYAPEYRKPGIPAGRDFVGWTGVSAINMLIEFVLGIRQQDDAIHWAIHLTERHGVQRYPFGDTLVDLICEQRQGADEPPVLNIRTTSQIQINIHCNDDSQKLELPPGEHRLELFRQMTSVSLKPGGNL